MIYGQNPSKESKPIQTDADGRLLTVAKDASGNDVAGAKITDATMPSGGSGLLGWLSAIWYRLTQPLYVGAIANPTAVYTRPSDTTAYAANDLVSNNTTAGLVVVQSFTATRVAAGSVSIPKIVLLSNHTTGLSGIGFAARLWSAAPTYTNGDNGAYAVATGAANFLGKYTGTFEQFADGAVAELIPVAGSFGAFKLASGSVIYVDLQTLAVFTPQSEKTFTLVPQLLQD